jgi:hypothetical protein
MCEDFCIIHGYTMRYDMRSGFHTCKECEMSELGNAWNDLTEGERRALLTFAGIWKENEIIFYEATLKWNQLLPSTQDKILERLAGKR